MKNILNGKRLMVKQYLILLRVYQYIKNFFIFFPIFFGLKILDIDILFDTIISFVAFSIITSSIYIFNDYKDIEDDRKHPVKKNRPLASGTIPYKKALFLMVFLLIFGLLISFFVKRTVFYLVILYIILNFFYTIKLKQFVIIDTFIIALGFIIRIFIGYEISDLPVSMWIVLMTFLLALFLALAKRRDDLIIFLESGVKTRKIVDGYNLEFLNISIMIMTSAIIVTYIMYTVSPEIIMRVHSDKLYLTVFLVIMGIMRYLQLTFVQNNSGSPTLILIKDRFLQIIILFWLASFIFILYL